MGSYPAEHILRAEGSTAFEVHETNNAIGLYSYTAHFILLF
jgi:hypothetical protein